MGVRPVASRISSTRSSNGSPSTLPRSTFSAPSRLTWVVIAGARIRCPSPCRTSRSPAETSGVVNQWGSWCPPCRAEFPYFAQMAAKYQDRVAFIGLDAADSRSAAEQFLREVPPGFPAIAQGLEVRTKVLALDAVPRALVSADTRGLFKLVAEADSGRVVGVSILAHGAPDVIQAAVLAIDRGMTVSELGSTWAPYLAMAEGLKLAAQTFDRDVSKLSCCAA